jgi:multisubunit Na+/H+ antiporter MnhE subunit
MLVLAICMAAMLMVISIWFFVAGGWKTADGITGYCVSAVLLAVLFTIMLYSRHRVKVNRDR